MQVSRTALTPPPHSLHIPHHYTKCPHSDDIGGIPAMWSLVSGTVCATQSQHQSTIMSRAPCARKTNAYAIIITRYFVTVFGIVTIITIDIMNMCSHFLSPPTSLMNLIYVGEALTSLLHKSSHNHT